MSLVSLPDDLILEIARFLNDHDLLSFSQSSRTIYLLSNTYPSFWYNGIIPAHLPYISPLSHFSAAELRSSAVRAYRCKLNLQQAESDKVESYYSDVDTQAAEVIPEGTQWLFLVSPKVNPSIICIDLKLGKKIGSHQVTWDHLHYVPPTGAKQLAAESIAPDHVRIVLLIGESLASDVCWLVVIDVLFRTDSEIGINASFSTVHTARIPVEGLKNEKIGRDFDVVSGLELKSNLISWTQNINLEPGQKNYAPVVTLVRIEEQGSLVIAHWTCGWAKEAIVNTYTIFSGRLIVITHALQPRLFCVSLEEIFGRKLHSSDIYRPVDTDSGIRLTQPPLRARSNSRMKLISIRLVFDIHSSYSGPGFDSGTGTYTGEKKLPTHKLRLLGVAHYFGQGSQETQIYNQDLFLHLQENSNDFKLHAANPQIIAERASYLSRHGIQAGIAWYVTFGTPQIVYIDTGARGFVPLGHSRPRAFEPVLFDLRSGVFCAFRETRSINYTPTTDVRLKVEWFGPKDDSDEVT